MQANGPSSAPSATRPSTKRAPCRSTWSNTRERSPSSARCAASGSPRRATWNTTWRDPMATVSWSTNSSTHTGGNSQPVCASWATADSNHFASGEVCSPVECFTCSRFTTGWSFSFRNKEELQCALSIILHKHWWYVRARTTVLLPGSYMLEQENKDMLTGLLTLFSLSRQWSFIDISRCMPWMISPCFLLTAIVKVLGFPLDSLLPRIF